MWFVRVSAVYKRIFWTMFNLHISECGNKVGYFIYNVIRCLWLGHKHKRFLRVIPCQNNIAFYLTILDSDEICYRGSFIRKTKTQIFIIYVERFWSYTYVKFPKIVPKDRDKFLIKMEKWDSLIFLLLFISFLLRYNTVEHKRKSFSTPKIKILI